MADDSVHTVPYIRSDNQKADIINRYLREHKIALQTLARHPDVLREFKNEVMSGSNHPEPEVPVKNRFVYARSPT